jgi:hypothetical protein
MELLPGEGLGLFKLGELGARCQSATMSSFCNYISTTGMTLWDTINLLRSTSARLLGNLTQSAITWSNEVSGLRGSSQCVTAALVHACSSLLLYGLLCTLYDLICCSERQVIAVA